MTDTDTPVAKPSIYESMLSMELNEFKTSVNNKLELLSQRLDTLQRLLAQQAVTSPTAETNGQIKLNNTHKQDVYMELLEAQQLQIDKLSTALTALTSNNSPAAPPQQLIDQVRQSTIKPVKYVSAEGQSPVRRTQVTDAIDSIIVLFAAAAFVCILGIAMRQFNLPGIHV